MHASMSHTQPVHRGAKFAAEFKRALILDDSEIDRMRVRRMCAAADLNLEFDEASTIREFEAALDAHDYDLVFLDYILAQGDGLMALEILRRHSAQRYAAAIMIAGLGQIQIAIDALKNGCSDYIIKENLSPDVLARSVNSALDKARSFEAARVYDETESRMRRALSRFEAESAGEIRSILSGMMRRTRSMKVTMANGALPEVDTIEALEGGCTRLWEFLGNLQNLLTESVGQVRHER